MTDLIGVPRKLNFVVTPSLPPPLNSTPFKGDPN